MRMGRLVSQRLILLLVSYLLFFLLSFVDKY